MFLFSSWEPAFRSDGASPNGFVTGTSVKHVLQQDKAAFVRLVGVSILQSAVSAFLAPSLRFPSFFLC